MRSLYEFTTRTDNRKAIKVTFPMHRTSSNLVAFACYAFSIATVDVILAA